jgi:hypothetical protein
MCFSDVNEGGTIIILGIGGIKETISVFVRNVLTEHYIWTKSCTGALLSLHHLDAGFR